MSQPAKAIKPKVKWRWRGFEKSTWSAAAKARIVCTASAAVSPRNAA
ncbi:MAG: hypothetical protein IPI35_28215, partial [Deltaproteobacteria bacterium]|nr:hypothetical protein [Deltaproteobacteria bacterium]